MATKIRALVADDSRLNRALLSHVLTDNGYFVLAVETGLEALLEVQKQEFDLILMDLEMPALCGLDATAAIRQLDGNRYQRLMIVGKSAQQDSSVEEICLARGMNAFLTKPIHPCDLLYELERLRGTLRRLEPPSSRIFSKQRMQDSRIHPYEVRPSQI